MGNAVLIEIEKLRRASLSALRVKYQEVFQEDAFDTGAGVVDNLYLGADSPNGISHPILTIPSTSPVF
jgi:hypothetical protein